MHVNVNNHQRSGYFSFLVKIVKKKDSNKSKGFGYVTFTTESDAQKAKMEMNGQVKCIFCLD